MRVSFPHSEKYLDYIIAGRPDLVGPTMAGLIASSPFSMPDKMCALPPPQSSAGTFPWRTQLRGQLLHGKQVSWRVFLKPVNTASSLSVYCCLAVSSLLYH